MQRLCSSRFFTKHWHRSFLSFPLSKDTYEKELKLIERITVYNGFDSVIIHKLVKNQICKKDVQNSTSLLPDVSTSKLVKLPFGITTRKCQIFSKVKILKLRIGQIILLFNVFHGRKCEASLKILNHDNSIYIKIALINF